MRMRSYLHRAMRGQVESWGRGFARRKKVRRWFGAL